MKKAAAYAALPYVEKDSIVGVGTGSTVNHFIDALATMKNEIKGAVSSSEASTEKLKAYGIEVFDLNEVSELSVYVDGADEINPYNHMIKGGGAALTREKIVAAVADKFICIVDNTNDLFLNRRPSASLNFARLRYSPRNLRNIVWNAPIHFAFK